MKQTYERLVNGIKEYFKNCNKHKAVIGLSGGIDSSLCAKLVSDALGKDNVFGIIMPVKGLSNEDNIKDTIEYCKWLGIDYCVIYINDFLNQFEKLEWKQNKLAKLNTASRIRAVILYNYANTHDALVVGTSNKTEILLGYFTKYGDGAIDFEAIGSLYKTDEIELAKTIELPEKMINKVPTAELYHGQTDEEEIGASYEVIDEILKHLENNDDPAEMIKKHGEKIVNRIISMKKCGEHKRNCPPVI